LWTSHKGHAKHEFSCINADAGVAGSRERAHSMIYAAMGVVVVTKFMSDALVGAVAGVHRAFFLGARA